MGVPQVSPLLFLLAAVNIISLVVFGFDKVRSMRHGWRIPESSLLLTALLGPFGAFSAMLLFRHKTRKLKFILVPIFLLVQLYIIFHFRLS